MTYSLTTTQGQNQWEEIKSVKDVCLAYPDKMKEMLNQFDLSLPELAEVKKNVDNNDIVSACTALLAHYKTKYPQAQDFPTQPSSETTDSGEDLIKDIFVFYTIKDEVPRDAKNRLQWDYEGPDNDIEWAWALNRHFPLLGVLTSFQKTGNIKYADYMDQFIKDWIFQSWPYPAKKSNTAMWRGLEVSFRAKAWSKVFTYFANSDLISPATKLLILASIPDHAHYSRSFHNQNNWLTMEISGLATVATTWPEYQKSKEWLEYSIATMTESLKAQLYPDGVQTELSSHYHKTARSNFVLFENICQANNISLPSFFTESVEDMWNYHATSIRPTGYGILNNDSDLDYNRDLVMKYSEKYDRRDWQYIVSNGEIGERPSGPPSVIYPWAGQLISRSDYDEMAHWSFFDIGPWGTGHQHNDKLHLSITAYGRDLIVDGGRFAYRGEIADKFRSYAKGSQSHNTVIIDQKGQGPGPKLTEEPLPSSHYSIDDERDWAWSSMDHYPGINGNASHTRTVQYERDAFWVVVDQIQTDRPRDITTFWHWHPDCEVDLGKNNVVSSQNQVGNLQIIPIQSKDWTVDLVKGQSSPEIQGWYSSKYNTYEANTAAIYNSHIDKSKTFVWLLMPSKDEVQPAKVKILAMDENHIKLKIKYLKKKHIVTVPLPVMVEK
ncbi:alginate lyase family protein [Membranihabitans marinus]